jgi:hypothetical protein
MLLPRISLISFTVAMAAVTFSDVAVASVLAWPAFSNAYVVKHFNFLIKVKVASTITNGRSDTLTPGATHFLDDGFILACLSLQRLESLQNIIDLLRETISLLLKFRGLLSQRIRLRLQLAGILQ